MYLPNELCNSGALVVLFGGLVVHGQALCMGRALCTGRALVVHGSGVSCVWVGRLLCSQGPLFAKMWAAKAKRTQEIGFKRPSAICFPISPLGGHWLGDPRETQRKG